MECRGIGIINITEMFGVKSVRLEKRNIDTVRASQLFPLSVAVWPILF
jgi:HPr kinase/phosphorylase